MSFSFSFTAKSRDDAKRLLEQQTQCPKSVESFIMDAIEGIAPRPPLASGADSVGVSVDANGHLAKADNYQTSNAKIEVKPIYLSEPASLGREG